MSTFNAAGRVLFGSRREPYLNMITEYEGTATTFSYGANVQPGDLVIVCASGNASSTVSYPGKTLTPTNATLAISKTHNYTTSQSSGGTDTPPTTVYNTAIAAVYYRIAQSETSIVISGAGDVSGYVIRNANGRLTSASVFATATDTDGDITISNATNAAGTVRAVAIYAFNTVKYVLNGNDIGTIRTKDRDTTLGYEETVVGERIFGANDNDNLQDCCSIDPQSGTGSLRLDSEQFNASAAAVLTVR